MDEGVLTTGTNLSVLGNVSEPSELTMDEVLHLSAPALITAAQYTHLVWYGIGFLGNALSAYIWNVKMMYEVCSSAHYLVSISICDIVCQTLHVFYYMKLYWLYKVFDTRDLCETWSVLFMIPLYISELLVFGFTVEKLVAIQNPFDSGWFNRYQRAPKEIVWIVVSVTVFAIPQAYFWKVDNKGGCDTDRLADEKIYPMWLWVTDSFIYLIIPISVVVLNISIICHTRQSVKIASPRNRLHRDAHVRITGTLRRSTVVLLRLSFFRVFTLFPLSIADFLKHLHYFDRSLLKPVYSIDEAWVDERWYRYIIYSIVYHALEIVSSSRYALSIFIFITSSVHFRRELKVLYWRIIDKLENLFKGNTNYAQ